MVALLAKYAGMAAARGWKAYPGLAAAKQAKVVYGPQQMQYATIITTTILDTSFSAFWVDSDSFCCMATCDWQTDAGRDSEHCNHSSIGQKAAGLYLLL